MSSRFRASALAIALAALAIAGCDREERHSRSKPVTETIPAGQSPDTIYPGTGTAPPLDARAALYDNNAPALALSSRVVLLANQCLANHAIAQQLDVPRPAGRGLPTKG